MRVAAFATWGTTDLPNYTKYHIDQLAPWHDEVHILTQEGRPVDPAWAEERGYFLHFFPNKGRDYEKYYYWLMKMGRQWIVECHSVSLINDSIVCYGPLDVFFKWVRTKGEDMVGLNGMKFPLPHVQGSPFIANKNFLGTMWDHFQRTGVVEPIKEIEHYELAFPTLSQSMTAMFPLGPRRGWDELFSVPMEAGVPLVKHYCISPRKPFLLAQWQSRILKHGHPDCKAWMHLPILLDGQYKFRAEGNE